MKKVIIASENTVKIEVARRAFSAVFPDEVFEFVGVKSASEVPDQPMNDETKQGALNRLAGVRAEHPEADFWISQEGGLFEDGERLYNRAWIAVTDSTGYVGTASTASFYLPTEISKRIRAGLELSHAADEFFDTEHTGTGTGVIGHLTNGLIDRTEYYVPAAIIAISELRHKAWY